MIGFRRGYNPLCSGHENPCFVCCQLIDRFGFDKPFGDKLTHCGRHAVISKSASMNGCGNKGMPQTVHGEKRGVFCRIPVIISKRCSCQRGARGRFNRIYLNFPAVNLVTHIRIGKTCEIAPSARTSDHDIRILSDLFHLFFGFKADNGLMEHHMIENTSQRIACLTAFVGDSGLNSFADGDGKTSRGVRIAFENVTAGFCQGTGACDTVCAPSRHQGFPIGFLIKTDPDHKHLAFQSELGTRERKRASPLTGPGFRGQLFDAENLVVIGLGHCGIRLVAPRRTQALVLKINSRRRIQCFFKGQCPYQRSRPPDF